MSTATTDLGRLLADSHIGTPGDSTLAAELLERASRDDYHEWLNGSLTAAGCLRPIRLRGTIRDLDPATGEVIHALDWRHPRRRDLPALRAARREWYRRQHPRAEAYQDETVVTVTNLEWAGRG